MILPVVASSAPPRVAPPLLPATEDRKQSWFVIGVGAMVFPFSLAVALVAAPAIWMLSPRDRKS